VGAGVGVWIIAAVGLCSLLWHGESRRHGILAGGLLFFSFLAVCPALFFRDHYFILMLPAVALLAGLGVHAATQALARRGGLALAAIPVLVFSAACGYALVEQRAFLLEKDPVVVCEERYSTNPFPEAVVVAQYLNAHTAADEPIAVLGSEPEIYFYAKRHSATGFIYLYGLMEEQKYAYEMQRQMIGEVEAAQPKYLVVAKNRLSWMAHEGSPQAVAMSAWLGSFLAGYELVGVVERVGDHIAYHWDDDARAYEPHSQNILGVFRRKS
jgi:hypothetical protein